MTDLPGQPDGIEDDSRDLPNPVRAAERVREYICASGDGLYDIQGGAPLYARDLEAITRAVRDRATALEPPLPLPVADGREVEQGQERSEEKGDGKWCDDEYAGDSHSVTHTCGLLNGHAGSHLCRCTGLESYTWPAGASRG